MEARRLFVALRLLARLKRAFSLALAALSALLAIGGYPLTAAAGLTAATAGIFLRHSTPAWAKVGVGIAVVTLAALSIQYEGQASGRNAPLTSPARPLVAFLGPQPLGVPTLQSEFHAAASRPGAARIRDGGSRTPAVGFRRAC